MRAFSRQEGITIWGVMGLSLIGIFFLLLMFKLIPPYMDDFKVGSAIRRVAEVHGAGSMAPDELKSRIDKMFSIENISHVNAQTDIQIEPQGPNAKNIKLEYEVEVKMTDRISVLLYFDHAVEAR